MTFESPLGERVLAHRSRVVTPGSPQQSRRDACDDLHLHSILPSRPRRLLRMSLLTSRRSSAKKAEDATCPSELTLPCGMCLAGETCHTFVAKRHLHRRSRNRADAAQELCWTPGLVLSSFPATPAEGTLRQRQRGKRQMEALRVGRARTPPPSRCGPPALAHQLLRYDGAHREHEQQRRQRRPSVKHLAGLTNDSRRPYDAVAVRTATIAER